MQSIKIDESLVYIDSSLELDLVEKPTIDIESWSLLTKAEQNDFIKIKHKTRRYEYLRSRLLLKTIFKNNKLSFHRNKNGHIDFPKTHIGSLSHKKGIIVIYAEKITPSNNMQTGIGIDIESTKTDFSKIKHKFLSSGELEILENNKKFFNKETGNNYLSAIFSAKESIFKAHNPIHKKMFFFHDATLTDFNLDTLEFKINKPNLIKNYESHRIIVKYKFIRKNNEDFVVSLVKDSILPQP